MDKNGCLRELADIKTRSAVCPSVQKLAEILMRVVTETHDSDSESRVAKNLAYSLKAAASLDKRVEVLESIVKPIPIPTIEEMLDKHKRDTCEHEANRRIDSMLRKVMQRSLSFAEAIEVVRETGASVAHEYWQSTRLVPSSNVAGFMVVTCGLHTNMLTLYINMIDSGWRVLDK